MFPPRLVGVQMRLADSRSSLRRWAARTVTLVDGQVPFEFTVGSVTLVGAVDNQADEDTAGMKASGVGGGGSEGDLRAPG
jgi:hypothetical protein